MFADSLATMLIRTVQGVMFHFQKDLGGATFPISVENCGCIAQVLHTKLVLGQ